MVAIFLTGTILAECNSTRDLETLVDMTWVFFGILLVTVAIGVVVSPSNALLPSAGLLGYQVRGLFPAIASNGVGDISALLGVVSVSRLSGSGTSRRWWMLLIVATGVLLISQTRSAWLGFVLGTLLVLVMNGRLRALGAILLGAVGLAATEAVDTIVAYLGRGQSVGLIRSLSGRFAYWEYAGDLLAESPVLGLGAYAAGRFAVLAVVGSDEVSSVHNAWVEVAVGVGLLGLTLLAALVLSVWARLLGAIRSLAGSPAERRLGVEMAGVLALETARSFFTSGALVWHPATRFLLAVLVAEWLWRFARSLRADSEFPA